MIQQEKNIEVKNEFFVSTYYIENLINDSIANKIGVENMGNSEMLGELTFDQKIEFLLETGNFSIIDNSKLSVFRAIRDEFNEYEHTNSIEESFTSTDNNADFLLILYPQEPFLPRNEKLTVALYNLIDDVKDLVNAFTETTNNNEIKMYKSKSVFGININTQYLSKVSTMLLSLILLR